MVAFNIATLFWLLCGAANLAIALTIEKDVALVVASLASPPSSRHRGSPSTEHLMRSLDRDTDRDMDMDADGEVELPMGALAGAEETVSPLVVIQSHNGRAAGD